MLLAAALTNCVLFELYYKPKILWRFRTHACCVGCFSFYFWIEKGLKYYLYRQAGFPQGLNVWRKVMQKPNLDSIFRTTSAFCDKNGLPHHFCTSMTNAQELTLIVYLVLGSHTTSAFCDKNGLPHHFCTSMTNMQEQRSSKMLYILKMTRTWLRFWKSQAMFEGHWSIDECWGSWTVVLASLLIGLVSKWITRRRLKQLEGMATQR